MKTLSAAAAACLAFAACAGQQTQKQTAKDAAEAKIWDEKSPYGFHRAVTLTLLRTKQTSRAVPHIQQLLALKPDSPQPHYLMARAQADLGMLSQAHEELRQALELDKNFAPAYALRGVLLDRQGRSKQAENAHRQAVKLKPKHAAYHNNLGFCLFLQKRYKAAIVAYRKALAYHPTMRRVHNNIGFSYAKLGKLDLAYKHFQLGGQPPQADNNMGFAYERRGQLHRAYEHYLRAATSAPELEPARVNLARVCQQLGKPLPKLLSSMNSKKTQKQKMKPNDSPEGKATPPANQ